MPNPDEYEFLINLDGVLDPDDPNITIEELEDGTIIGSWPDDQ